MTAPSTALEQARTGGLAVFTEKSNPWLTDAKNEGVTDGFWLRMNGSTGIWLSNLPDHPELEQGTELVFDLYHAENIWQGFDPESKLHTGPKASIVSGLPLADPQPKPGVKWKKQVRVMVATTDGGQQLMLTCKGDNPYREIRKLVKRFGQLVSHHPDPGSKTGYKLPIVKIESESYEMMATERKAVIDEETGKEVIRDVKTKVFPFREKFTITDDDKDWISQAQMEEILGAADVENAGEPAPVDKQIAAKTKDEETPWADADADAVPDKAALRGEVIPPTKPTGESSFRRHRAGQTGVRSSA